VNFFNLATEFVTHDQWWRPPFARISKRLQFRATYAAVGNTEQHFSVEQRWDWNVSDLKFPPGRVVERLHSRIPRCIEPDQHTTIKRLSANKMAHSPFSAFPLSSKEPRAGGFWDFALNGKNSTSVMIKKPIPQKLMANSKLDVDK
jgi:hypothetical protein